MKKRLYIIIILLVIAIVVLSSSLYKVDQRNQAIVLQFGEVIRTEREAGLKFKLPFFQDVIFYDKRILDVDPRPFEVLVTDQKRILVDAFARYRITDPTEFYKRVRTYTLLEDRFGKNLNASMQRIFATVSLSELLSEKRQGIMDAIATDVREQAESFGIELLEVRIGRTELPPATREAVFQRMQAERNKEANDLRARGGEAALKITAEADKKSTIIIAEAKRSSEILRGQGEGLRNSILGKAYGASPEFFAFFKSLEEYKKSLTGENSTWIISPDSDYFNYINRQSGN